ncbi:unnamed protein product [Trypanosoma congolense IL3000]|uniref:WGS project CAEQ00000000 data, annotated contig 1667 n=1 Tax=Trypanosoma congolense (strain IL3000) TaxID=1068625 RepID=F9W7X0_TRYCI|nr:unnamed protein product [Trypanosoma congolense IL3000]
MEEVRESTTTNPRERIERMMQQQGRKKSDRSDTAEVLHHLQESLQQKEKEYWQLHHESTLDGGSLKTRFKYREVAPENFTLSVEEILAQDDRQLNMLVPMNCYAAYLTPVDNRRDRIKVEKRRRRGFREIDSSRSSRRYGDVSKTALVDPNMEEEEGVKWSQNVRASLRRLHEDANIDSGERRRDNVERNNGVPAAVRVAVAPRGRGEYRQGNEGVGPKKLRPEGKVKLSGGKRRHGE